MLKEIEFSFSFCENIDDYEYIIDRLLIRQNIQQTPPFCQKEKNYFYVQPDVP